MNQTRSKLEVSSSLLFDPFYTMFLSCLFVCLWDFNNINPSYEESVETSALLIYFLKNRVNKFWWSVEPGLAEWNHTPQLSIAFHTFRPAGSSCQETADDCSDNQPCCGGVTHCQDRLKCCHSVAMRTQASCYWQVGTVLLQACRWPWLSRAMRRGTQEHGKPWGILGRGQCGLRSHVHTQIYSNDK